MPKKLFEKIKKDYLNGTSLRQLEAKYGVNRKKISVLLKEHGIEVHWRYTEKIIMEAQSLLVDGNSLMQVATKLHVDRDQLARALEKRGIRDKQSPKDKKAVFTKNKETDNIAAKYADGLSLAQIANEIGKSTNYVCRVLEHYDGTDTSRTSRIYHFDESIFETVDTEEKAYWLGFLYADGSVSIGEKNVVEISLKKEDKLHLEKFSDFIGATPAIPVKSKYVQCNGKQIKVYRIYVSSKKLAYDLTKLGCMPRKSLILRFPDWILESPYLNHFMRGMFDGDGSLTLAKQTPGNGQKRQIIFGLISTNEFCDAYEQILLDKEIIRKRNKRSKEGQAYSFSYGGNVQAKRFFDFIYKDATIYLQRKYEKFIAGLSGDTGEQ